MASTPDLHFISPDIRLDAGGALRLDGSAVNLIGSVELSEALTKQANAAFVRVAAQNGKISLPITIRGNAGKCALEIDTASVAKRAATAEVKSRSRAKRSKVVWGGCCGSEDGRVRGRPGRSGGFGRSGRSGGHGGGVQG